MARPTTYPAIEALADQMRAAGRTELVHFAGAAHRDGNAWDVCLEWLADPSAPEEVLRERALQRRTYNITR